MGEIQEIIPGSIIVTGATGSMGAVAVRKLAAAGVPVIMACRNVGKAGAVAGKLLAEMPEAKISIRELNLESLSSVREFAEGLKGTELGGLFNNAGTMCRDYGVTTDGFEKTMAVNYLAPYLLTRLLLPCFQENAHIVNMVSVTTKIASLDLGWPEYGAGKFSQLGTYGKSKLAFLLFTVALARRYPKLYVNLSDPGVVNSNMISLHRWFDPLADIFFRPFIKTPEQGVQPALNALASTERLKYFVDDKCKDVPGKFLNNPLVDKLWDQAAEMTGLCD